MKSFRSKYGVDDRFYMPWQSHAYGVASTGKPSPPMPGVIGGAMSHNPVRYRKDWRAAYRNAWPAVQVSIGHIRDEKGTYRLRMLVDTGAAVSTVTSETADWLAMRRDLLTGECLVSLTGASGGLVAGLPRWMCLEFGGATRIIPVLVPPRDPRLLRFPGGAIASPPTSDVLGRAEIFENFLLCFDHEELDVFCRKTRP